MDEETIGKVKNLLLEAAKKHNLDLVLVKVFGSWAREDQKEGSDVDLLVVSKDFMDVAWNKRPGPFYEEWDYEELPDPEFICLTPEEFREKKKREPNIVRTAVEEGMAIA